MPKTIFIGDLHLDKRFPKALSAFLSYLQNIAHENVDALYIVGDLFEYWLGDDCLDNTSRAVAQGLSDYHNSTATPIYFTHGNRDFLLGESYAQQCQFTLLSTYHAIKLYDTETLILHGDTLCTDDVAYMRFRVRVHDPEWQAKIKRLPPSARRLLATYLRMRSKWANANKTQAIMDVAPDTVADVVRQYGVKRLIHGHTHRPALHQLDIDGNRVQRCVVGDWYTQGSVLEVTPDNVELLTLPFSQT